ncbi:30S ribosomal protein S4 [Pasteuria penetrans]|uniref:30S ribosomal protein S4 n=1 Tax=Pasteuria penetrans TaxID=86005 RepID=UPI000FAE9E2C|nr:30S ribosomal protein S4 [Pasteuria penetrans]
MARYTGPRWKISRRLGISLSGTGKELKKRSYGPGQHGPSNQRRKVSDYSLQLQEKQKLRWMYGLGEKQFHNLFKTAGKKPGIQGHNFFILLETRLDNLVYRLGLASSRPHARQLVVHGHITVDGRKMDRPSYNVKPGQTISLREKSLQLAAVKQAIEVSPAIPQYLSFDANKRIGTLERLPERGELPGEINEALVVEFYA